MTKSSDHHYTRECINDTGKAAKKLLAARDQYIRAWMEWNSTCLGCFMTARDEAEVIQYILENSRREKTDGENT